MCVYLETEVERCGCHRNKNCENSWSKRKKLGMRRGTTDLVEPQTVNSSSVSFSAP